MDKLGLAEDRFSGRLALIMGSAKGIGEATTRALTFLGGKVIIVDGGLRRGAPVHEALPTGFLYEPRGFVNIKGKALMPTWFLTGLC